jgi:hypothetical protein
MPWNYIRFLDYAVDRIFLRKVGGAYLFVHGLVQEYFATLYAVNEAAPTGPTQPKRRAC